MYYSALLGKPVEHSISPALFGLLARQANLDYAHIKIEVPEAKQLPDYLEHLRSVGFVGVNITLPYKLSVMPFLDEIDRGAAAIGAVNTVAFREGKMIGYNTDSDSALEAIETQLRLVQSADKILVLGAGGVARAAIYAIYKKSKNISILSIDLEQAKQVAKDLSDVTNSIKVDLLTPENIVAGIQEADFIINATSVGMSPESDKTLANKELLAKAGDLRNKYFFDVIFNPYLTLFLTEARGLRANVCSGLYMMIYQAIGALEVWTKIKLHDVPIETIAAKLIQDLNLRGSGYDRVSTNHFGRKYPAAGR